MRLYSLSRIVFTLLVVSVLAGCNLPVPATPQPAPVTEQAQPTQVIPPTPTEEPPTPTQLPPTETPLPTESPNFTEEFSGGLEGWSYFLTRGNESDATFKVADDALSVFLLAENTWAYIAYDAVLYQDVEISTVAENRGSNVNNISLICQYSELGWYEFNISSAGVYNILAYDNAGTIGTQGYNLIKEGTSTLIKTGFATNTITATCEKNNLTFMINDEEVVTLTDDVFVYEWGRVGLSAKSLEQKPVAVLFHSFTVTEK